MARKLEVQIVGDASSLKRALGDAEGHTSRFGGALGGLAKAGVVAAGAAGVGALFLTLKEGIGDFTESAKVSAQTEAVIKSTGGSAKVTAKQVGDLATAISNYSGIDDEAVQAGENMLLTFTNIRDEAGKGNDIFNQSTKILADMSTALGQDMSKSAIQLGKALNDPIKGVTALQRVGVTFTQAQRDQIKALVESGHTMEAQKLILRELNKEFGGSAEAAGKTLPGQLSILKNAFDNLAGSLVGAAVPAITGFVGFLTEKGLPAMQEFGDKIGGAIGPTIEKLGDAFTQAGPGIMAVLKPIGDTIANTLVPIFRTLADIGTQAIQRIGQVLADHGPQIRQIFENIGTVIKNLAAVIIPILRFAFTVILPAAIAVLIPILQGLTVVLAAVSGAVRGVASGFMAAPSAVRTAMSAIGSAITGGLSAIKNALVSAAGWVFRQAVAIGQAIVSGVVSGLGSLISRVAGAIKSGLSSAIHSVGGIFHGSGEFMWTKQVIGEPMIDGIIEGIRGREPQLQDAIRRAMTKTALSGKLALKETFDHSSIIAPVAGAKKAFDDWADSVGADNLSGVGSDLAEALRQGLNEAVAGRSRTPIMGALQTHGVGGTAVIDNTLRVSRSGPTIPGGDIINITFPNYVGSKQDITDAVYEGLLRKKTRNGTLGF